MSGAVTIRELVTRLGFDVDDEKLDKFEKRVDTVKTGLLAFVGVAAAAAAGLFAMAKSAASVGEETLANSQLVGLSIDEYQRYANAASLAEVSNENFQVSLQFLTRNIGDANRGSKQLQETFSKLGVRTKDAEGKARATGEVLADLREKFQGIEDPTLRASLAVDLFGRGGLRMGRFLAMNADEFERANQVVEAFGFFTEDSAAAGDKMGDALEMVATLAKGLRNEIGTKLFPAITQIAEGTIDWVLANRDLIRTKVDRFVTVVVRGLSLLGRGMAWVARMGASLVRMLGGMENVLKMIGIGLAAAFGASVVGAIASLVTIVQALGMAFLVAWAKAFLPAVAVGVAIGLIILAVEDLYTWINGGESVLGRFLGSWVSFKEKALKQMEDLIPGLVVIVNSIQQIFGGLWDGLAGAFGMVLAIWRGDAEGFITNLKRWGLGLATALLKAPLELMAGLLQAATAGLVLIVRNVAKIIAEVVKAAIPPSLMKLATWAQEKGGQANDGIVGLLRGAADLLPSFASPATGIGAPALAGFAGGAADTTSAARSSVVNQGGNLTKIDMPITAQVYVPPGTSQEQAAFLESKMRDVANEVFGGGIRHVLQSNPRRE